MTQIYNQLRRLDRLFSDRSKWTTREIARDKTRRQIPARNKSAVCWCLAGGVSKVTDMDVFQSEVPLYLFLSKEVMHYHTLWSHSIPSFNDASNTEFVDIKEFLKYCINKARRLKI